MVTDELLQRVEVIARRAGDEIMRHYSGEASATLKTDGSPLTLADDAADRLIVAELKYLDPVTPIISEESAQIPYAMRRNWNRFWLVDPLDGTKEFLSRNGEFTVNIALIEDGEPVLGVVYAPALDLMYVAAKERGAWRIESSGPRTRIYSEIPSDDKPLVIVESRSHGSRELEEYLGTINVGGRVAMGSSLKFCIVAEGGADIYPRLGPTMEWDVAAGDCVYRNSARKGQRWSPLTYNKPDLRNESFVIGLSSAMVAS
jgi:3'(2'), 5'-bisphosphate nucleotidase